MASGTISLGTVGYMTAQIVWSSSSNGSTANTSTVTATLQVAKTHSYTTWGTWTGNLNIGGNDQSFSIYAEVNNSWVTVKSFSITKAHNDNGTGNCYIYGKINGPSGTSLAGKSLEGSQTVTLDTIPRYASISSFSTTAQTLNTATFKWSTNVNCSKIEYKIGSGSYVNANQTGTGNTFKISGLSPSTTYKVKLRVTRSDSGLLTESSEVSVTTLAIATITSASDFNIGNSPTINFNNPSGNAIAVYMEMDSNNTNISNGTFTVTGRTSYQFTNVNASRIYSSIPNSNSKSFRYVIRTTEGSNNYYSTVTKTAYVVNSNPTIGTCTYQDSNSSSSAITEDSSKIVRNQSNLLFTVGTATAKNSATISSYAITFNGITRSITSAGTIDFGTINLSNTATATLKVTDSRGNYSTRDISVFIVDWVAPTGIITLQRKNNYESETYLKVDGSYSYVNSKNSMTITYQYKKTTESNYNTATTINDNTQVTISLDNTFAWDFKICVSDRFTTSTYTTTLNIGVPILFIDAKTQKIGINQFPTSNGGRLQVNGDIEENGTLLSNKYKSLDVALVGQSSNTTTNPYYKFASVEINGNYQDRSITFKVSRCYGDGTTATGILTAHARTNGNSYWESGELKWEYANKGIDPSLFILAHNTSTKPTKVELWLKVSSAYTIYHMDVITTGTRTDSYSKSTLNGWTLYTTKTAGSNSAITSGYTQVVSDTNYFRNIFPIGYIYMSVNSTNPSTYFGGTWTQLKDRFLLGAGSTYSNGATGGSATHTLTKDQIPSHTHSFSGTTNKDGAHVHDSTAYGWRIDNVGSARSEIAGGSSGFGCDIRIRNTNSAHQHSFSGTTGGTGGGKAHNNMPPYLVVYMWKRTA